jgi:hypothetical protein
MGILAEILHSFGLARQAKSIDSADALADFVDRRASFLAQKCVIEFCRVRAGVYWQKLFEEAEFRDKLNVSCWESFAPSVAMVLEVADATLREAAGLRQRELPDALAKLGIGVIERYEIPAFVEPGYRQRQAAVVRKRMDELVGQAALEIRQIARPMARLVYANLPLHREIVKYDFDYIHNNLRMNLVRAHEDFIATADPAAIVADLLGEPGQ